MTLEELKTAVMLITSRPDLEDQTLQAIKAATLKAHSRDYWRRDLKEVMLQFDSAEYLQAFDVYDLLPKFRAINYVRKQYGELFEIIEPVQVFDYFKSERLNVAYLAGTRINLKSGTPFSVVHFGYYEHPDVTEASWNSWIAEEFPYAIIYGAAATLSLIIGHQETVAALEAKAREEFLIMQRTAISAESL